MAIHPGFLATEAENGFHHVGSQVKEVSVTVPMCLHHHYKWLWLRDTTPITMIIELLHWRGQQLVLHTALTHLQQRNNACDALCGLQLHMGQHHPPHCLTKWALGLGTRWTSPQQERPQQERLGPHTYFVQPWTLEQWASNSIFKHEVDKQTQTSECSSKPPRPRNNWWVKKNKLKRLTPVHIRQDAVESLNFLVARCSRPPTPQICLAKHIPLLWKLRKVRLNFHRSILRNGITAAERRSLSGAGLHLVPQETGKIHGGEGVTGCSIVTVKLIAISCSRC